jgi:putative spermidine/putrescine transport system ATP-binding protein
VTHLPPEKRGVGVVFQHYALFPHMTVAENIGFPLRMRGVSSADIRKRVATALDLVRMTGLEERFPSQLSGGQQQRTALARATVFNPTLLLLDEPLGALDKKLRENMQIELKELHRKLGPTMIHVTHDQAEALSLSDRVAVINDGHIEQLGPPSELYERPATRFVAEFIGESNTMAGLVRSLSGRECEVETRGGLRFVVRVSVDVHSGQQVSVVTRPENIAFGAEAAGLPNTFVGRVEDVSYVGQYIRYRISISPLETVTVSVPNRSVVVEGKNVGSNVEIGWHPQDCFAFPVA